MQETTSQNNKIWYDKRRLLSYNNVFNFLIGIRGGGKTYAFKVWAIEDFIKTGKQFVWIRRYKQEMKKAKLNFLNDLTNKFLGHTIIVKGDTLTVDGKTAGHFITLSISNYNKSAPYPEVTKIIFDEFIINAKLLHYLPDEVQNYFLELCSTIIRKRDNCLVVCIANSLTITNPYFIYFNVKKLKNSNFFVNKQLSATAEFYENKAYKNEALKTRFAQAINNTDYGAYNLDNVFLLDNDNFILPEAPKKLYYRATLIYNNNYMAVKMDLDGGIYYIDRKYDIKYPALYALNFGAHTSNTILIKHAKPKRLMLIVEAFKQGLCRFSDINTKNLFVEAMRLV